MEHSELPDAENVEMLEIEANGSVPKLSALSHPSEELVNIY